MGPSARKVLQAVTEADVSNEGFPFGHVREIAIAGHKVRALRVTYVGELGWELHVPIAAAGEVFDALMAAGEPHGIRPVGYRAMESLRLEKGYRAWGSDITPNDTPFEAGLGWAVKLRKNTDFLGRRALEKINGAALGKRLVAFTVDDPEVVLLGRETILRDGVAGRLSHQRRLWLYGRAADRLRLCAQRRRRHRQFPRRRQLRTRRGDGAGQGAHPPAAAL